MKQYNFQKGRNGEELAAQYLSSKGFQIVDRNFKNRFGEIDVIATRGNVLHFVEVKLKVGERFGTPEEMINKRKVWQITKTAESFLLNNKKIVLSFPKYQVDAICIVLDERGNEKRLDFYENLTLN